MIDIDYLNFLENILTDNRKEVQKVLEKDKSFHYCCGRYFQMHNTSAVMRSCEVFSIQVRVAE
jgi:tRNA (guanosine-2'-O-)-methyltransferase